MIIPIRDIGNSLDKVWTVSMLESFFDGRVKVMAMPHITSTIIQHIVIIKYNRDVAAMAVSIYATFEIKYDIKAKISGNTIVALIIFIRLLFLSSRLLTDENAFSQMYIAEKITPAAAIIAVKM